MLDRALIVAGLCRIVEICFVLKDDHSAEDGQMTAFQHLSPLLLVISGSNLFFYIMFC